ncbi:MAG: hypothetical protein AAGA54_05135 [Myxococcota bacterium]
MGLCVVLLAASMAGEVQPDAAPSVTQGAAATPTLPNAASYGPSRRGAWRVDANVPQGRPPDLPPPPPPVPVTTQPVRYAPYPYEGSTPGFVLRDAVPAGAQAPGRLHAARLALDGGQSGTRQGRAGAALRIALWRVGFDATVTSHFTGTATQGRPLRTTLVHGTTNGLVAPLMRPRVQWWVGAGLNYATLRGDVRVGPNLTSSLDVFPRRPLVMSVRGDVGAAGSTSTVGGRGSLGYMLRSVELQLGYEARRLGDLLLLGPVLGARAWF